MGAVMSSRHWLSLAVLLAIVTSTNLGSVDDDELGVSPFGTESFAWIPGATRDTRLPPGNHGRRIYQVEVLMPQV